MNHSEQLAETYLRHCGFTDIRFEPDGNIPPDFLADQKIAVEVRRLNKNHDDGSGAKGLEKLAISLWLYVQKLSASLGPPTHGQCWFVCYRFHRPVARWPVMRTALESTLRSFMTQTYPQPFEREIARGFVLMLYPANKVYPTFFVPLGHRDEQSAGFLIEEMAENLKLCISEKTQKIAAMRDKYPEWWLVLPDYIGWGLDDFDLQCVREQVTTDHTFDRVVLLDARDPTRAFRV